MRYRILLLIADQGVDLHRVEAVVSFSSLAFRAALQGLHEQKRAISREGHPDRSPVFHSFRYPADVVLPLLEKAGAVVERGYWVLEGFHSP